MERESQNPQVSTEPETQGFDLSAGETWIYPENFPIRKYQFDIVQATLYSNTLVCLPTGLGKTFIAAVVMYNFWRWYPRGKVVFLAPTKPLVAQQSYACHHIMGIPSTETIELTGAVKKKQREIAWLKKRVIFATPQVFHNDLEQKIVPAELVKCVVVDEAHKALGKHSYCECIRILTPKNPYYRVLALSATPGNKIENVREILVNLHISNLELRDETSKDIVPYVNQRKTDIIVVPLSNELERFKERYITIMDPHVKILLRNNILQGNTANISKGRVFHLMQEYQKKANKSGIYGLIVSTLNILVTMYHAYELMVRDGLRAFHSYDLPLRIDHSDKFWMNGENQLKDLLEDAERYLGPFPDTKSISNGHIPDISPNFVFGHTKFDKLLEILLDHFKSYEEKQQETRAIVFVEYRDIVHEVYILLLQNQPLIRPQIFVGQAGLKQKQQIKALDDFRSNRVNVLISTSIGEEGLDVGEVDLVVCFDISRQSPTRLVQRMGRTGRKREGRIIILVTNGREHETLISTMAQRDSINGRILNTSNILCSLYEDNPRMIPGIFEPACHQMYISVEAKSPRARGKGSKENAAATKPAVTQPKGCATQFSMTKFLKNDEPSRGIFQIQNPEKTQNVQTGTVIKPRDVNLLANDDDAIEFLTLCALKNSERETDPQSRKSAIAPYTRPSDPIPNFFSFLAPDEKLLNCLPDLEDVTLPEEKDYAADDDIENEKVNYGNVLSAEDEDVLADSTHEYTSNRKSIGVSRFEDLLDESSSSSSTEFSGSAKRGTREELVPVTTIFSEINRLTAASGSKPRALDDLEPGIFEEILDETSDDDNCTNTLNGEKVGEALDHSHGRTFVSEYKSRNNTVVASPENKMFSRSERHEKSMLDVDQAIALLARINSNASLPEGYPQSEDDMFGMDDDIDEVVDNTAASSGLRDFPIDNNKPNNLAKANESSKVEDSGAVRNGTPAANNHAEYSIEKEIEGCDWDDDFDICPAAVEQPRSSFDNTIPVCSTSAMSRKTSRGEKDVESEVKARSSSDTEWISVDSRPRGDTKGNSSNMSISKKLAAARKTSVLKFDRSKVRFAGTDESEDDFVLGKDELKEITDFENSYFHRPKGSQRKEIGEDLSVFFSDELPNEREKPRLKSKATVRTESSLLDRYAGKKRATGKFRRKVKSDFVCDEVEVSSDCNTSAGSSGTDEDLEGFVSHTQHGHDTSDMRAHYLQSIRSPVNRHGGFLFKKPRSPDCMQIYSQTSPEQQDSYLYDSFCVEGDDEQNERSSRFEGYSVLEEAERMLERKKRKRAGNDDSRDNAKRVKKKASRRNILNDSISSEDETERMRRQVQDESMLLKQLRDG